MESEYNSLDPYVKEANSMIDAVINRALAIHEKYLIAENDLNERTNIVPANEHLTMNKHNLKPGENVAPNIEWLTGENFTIESGEKKIDEFLQVEFTLIKD